MELIVNDVEFSEDFKKALGFPDADISFERLNPTLEIATDEIVDIITEDNYSRLVEFVNNNPVTPQTPDADFTNFSDLDDDKKAEFLKLVKYVMLCKAFNMYVGLGDLTVSNNGRTMRRDDHNVAAFNWQIEKHDAELEQLYFRHLDRMLRFMMKHNLKINQNKYKFKDLIINGLSQFEQFLDIKGSYALFIRLIPALREAEKLIILPRLGATLYEEVKADKTTDLAFLVQKAIVYHSIIWGLQKLEMQVFPKGMMSYNAVYNIINSRNTIETRVMRQSLSLDFEKDLERDLKTLEKLVKTINTPIEEITTDEIEMPEFGFEKNDGFVNL